MNKFTSDHSYIIFNGKVIHTTLKTWEGCNCLNDCDCLHNHCQKMHREATDLALMLNKVFAKLGIENE